MTSSERWLVEFNSQASSQLWHNLATPLYSHIPKNASKTGKTIARKGLVAMIFRGLCLGAGLEGSVAVCMHGYLLGVQSFLQDEKASI